MKKLLILFLPILMSVVLYNPAFAATGRIVSGPSGANSNGWYSGVPSVVVDSVPSCPSGTGTLSLYLAPNGGSVEEGRHYVTLRSFIAESWLGKGPYFAISDKSYTTGVEVGTNVWACPALGIMGGPTDPEVVWQGDIKWDSGSPVITINSPSNNSNIDGGTVSIRGTTSDSVSGVQSVSINGVAASLSGSNFTANVAVNNGLNTLVATSRDFAGHTSQAQVVVNRIDSCGSGGCSASGTSNGVKSTNNTQSSGQETTNAQSSNGSPNKEADKTDTSTPTIVKGVVQGGSIGLATILAFVVLLLILDKFRIIEIKAFSKITGRIAKEKPAKKNDK